MDDRLGPLVMRVFLVRHGEAAQAPRDDERPLTAAGREDVARLAEWCAAHDVAPREIRHSGLLRAAQTAKILAGRLAPPGGVHGVRGLAPEDDAASCRDDLVHETGPVMLVTHMPFVGELAALLAGERGSIGFATAQIRCFDREGEDFRRAKTWSPGAPDEQ